MQKVLPVVTLTWVGGAEPGEKETAGPSEGLLGSTAGVGGRREGEGSALGDMKMDS